MAPPARRTGIVVAVLAVSVVLYLAGVASGLFANAVLERRTQQDLSTIKYETQQDIKVLEQGTQEQIGSLQQYIDFLETSLKTQQLEQLFSQTLSKEESCALSTLSVGRLIRELQFYRDRLPFRIEEYERSTQLTPEYLQLKKQYDALSIQAWILARTQQVRCGSDLVDGLYFYSASCDMCVRQGEELDRYTAELQRQGRTILLFTIDANSDDPVVSLVKEYYGITQVPALVLNGTVRQGALFPVEELLR